MWLQNKRDATLQRTRGPSPRREDLHEYRVGRLKHERVTVPRDSTLLDWATQVMKHHAHRKSILEVTTLVLSLLAPCQCWVHIMVLETLKVMEFDHLDSVPRKSWNFCPCHGNWESHAI